MCIVGITIVAAVLRLTCLGAWSVWVDEANTWRDATMALDGEHGFLNSDRVLYPLTFVMLRFLFGVGALGFDEASIRLPFALFGIVTVPLMATCGRRLIGSWPAVVSAALLAINPWHVFWSQNARGYVLVVLGAVVAANRAHAWLHADRPRDLYLAVLSIVVAGLSHPMAGMLVIGFVGFLVARRALRGGRDRRRLLRIVVVFTLLLVVLPWLIEHYSPFQGFLRSKGGDPSARHFVETVVYYFRPTVLLLTLAALLLAPRMLDLERALLFGCVVVLPFLVLLVVGGQLAKVTARYAIGTLPLITWLLAALFAHVAARVGERKELGRTVRVALALLLPALVVGEYVQHDVSYFTRQHGQRARWREASDFVRAEAKRRGFDGVNAVTVSHPTLLYYLRRRHWFVTDLEPHPSMLVHTIERWMLSPQSTSDEAEERTHEASPAGFVDFHERLSRRSNVLLAFMVTEPRLAEKDPDGALAALLARDYELALHLPCWVGPKDESVFVYLPRRQP